LEKNLMKRGLALASLRIIVAFAFAIVGLTPAAMGGELVYVANFGGDSISVIDAKRNAVVDTIPTPSPYGLAVSDDGKALYVTDFGNTVSIFDTKTHAVVTTVQVGASPTAIALPTNASQRSQTCPDTTVPRHASCAYVTNYHSASVTVIDVDAAETVATIEVGLSPIAVTFSPDGRRAYVSNQESTTVSVIDTSTARVVDTVSVQHQPTGIQTSSDGLYVYVVNTNGVLSIIETATDTVSANVPLTSNRPTFYVALSHDDQHSYITFTDGALAGGVVVFDNIARTVVGSITVGKFPLGLDIERHGRTLYVANEDSDTVSVIDVATGSVTATIDVGRNPIAVAVER
jgi:YVTN family beta-propeller protein